MPSFIALRRHQRVRLSVTIAPELTGLNPWNLETEAGTYHTVWVEEETLQYRASHLGDADFWLQTSVAEGVIHGPRLIQDSEGTLRLLYGIETDEDQFDTMEVASWDGGQTWSEPAVAIADGTRPTIAMGLDGTILRAALVGGAIVATEQAPGDEAPGAEFTFADESGPLAFEDDSFHLQQEAGPLARWWLHGHLEGETDTADLWSLDGGRTWTLWEP